MAKEHLLSTLQPCWNRLCEGRHGGMSFDDPVADSTRKHADSLECTATGTLTRLILDGATALPDDIDFNHLAKVEIKQRHHKNDKAAADALQIHLPEPQRRAMIIAQEKGASSTLTTIPVAEHGFFFKVKSDFHDRIHLVIAGLSTIYHQPVYVAPS